MERDLNVMKNIIDQKKKDLDNKELPPLDPEGVKLAEHKRFTFDVIDTPVDPLR